MTSIKKMTGVHQQGGTFVGFIVGVVFGLAAALVVAVYVTKVPVPFVTKVQSRTADQDAAEAKKNKDWDPNAPLQSKTPIKPITPASEISGTEVVIPGKVPATGVVAPSSADPLGDLARVKSANVTVEPFVYYVQAGAFKSMEDAEAQRAKVSLAGLESKITERDQSGRPMYRVRTGPFDRKEEAERIKDKLQGAGFEAALVRVNR